MNNNPKCKFDSKSASIAGKKSKRPKLNERIKEYLSENIEDGKSREDKILDCLYDLAMKGSMQAITILLDRGYGRPKQTIETFSDISPVQQPIQITFTTEGFSSDDPRKQQILDAIERSDTREAKRLLKECTEHYCHE
jgi:hypothetical protein